MITSPDPYLTPGTLWPKIKQRTHQALACGALQPIQTQYEVIEQGGLRFLVRILTNLAHKESATRAQYAQQQAGKEVNPFLPYAPDLFVADLTPTHLCLLNKYNVIDHHILLVTRVFEAQDSWLNLADFQALALSMAEVDGLAFYNSGSLAGASQRHKHLQLIPAPLFPEDAPVLLSLTGLELRLNTFDTAGAKAESSCSFLLGRHPLLPFDHALVPLPPNWSAQGPRAGTTLLGAYQVLMTYLGMALTDPLPALPYNLLVTKDWMMAVGRSQADYQSIAVNALGFAGSLLVKNLDQLALLKTIGPLTVLQNVAYSSSPPPLP